MADIAIPKRVVKGFESIIILSNNAIEKIAEQLRNAKVTVDPNKILSQLELFITSDLSIKEGEEIVQAIASIADLVKDEEPEDISEKLSNSFKEIHKPDLVDEDLASLKNNLGKILTSSEKLGLSIKAYRLIRENNNTYTSSKVISDIRLIFDKEITSKNKRAVLIHNLHLIYNNNSDNKDFFLSLDLMDLKSLLEQIQRAIEKDKIIRTDCTEFEIL